jgi:V/A-type H+-transporting ATPase subunit E
MGIEEVRKEILENAKNQASQIHKDALKEKEAINNSADARISSIQERLAQETEKAVEQYKTMMLAEAASQAKKRRLAVEKEMIDQTFRTATAEIANLEPKLRAKHLKKLLTVNMPKIYCARQDITLLKEYNPTQADISGGIILENKEGDIRIDLSYDTLLERVKEEKLPQIAKILF